MIGELFTDTVVICLHEKLQAFLVGAGFIPARFRFLNNRL